MATHSKSMEREMKNNSRKREGNRVVNGDSPNQSTGPKRPSKIKSFVPSVFRG